MTEGSSVVQKVFPGHKNVCKIVLGSPGFFLGVVGLLTPKSSHN